MKDAPCPRCGREFESGYGVAIHWGRKHDGSPPDDLETAMPEDVHKKNVVEGKRSLAHQLETDTETRQRVEEELRH